MPNLRLTLRAWPVIAIATIGLSFLTQQGAKLLGIELPDQANLELVRRCFAQAFTSWRAFGVAAFLVVQVLVLMPAIEECVFRWGLFKLLERGWRRLSRGCISSKCTEKGQIGDSPIAHFGEMRPRRLRALLSSPAFFFALLSSALFSAAHYIAQPWPDSAFLALFFFGLAQCWIYRKTQRLWCAFTNHFLFNLTNLVLLLLFGI